VRVFDLLADKVFPPVDAVRVDMLQHAHAVARASGDPAGCSSGIQPQRQGGMPQVVMCSSRPLTGCCRIDPKINFATICGPDMSILPSILCGGSSALRFCDSPLNAESEQFSDHE